MDMNIKSNKNSKRVQELTLKSESGVDDIFLTMLNRLMAGELDCQFVDPKTGGTHDWHFNQESRETL